MPDLLERDLADLGRIQAPDGLAERVLGMVGVQSTASDVYTAVESSLGTLHVAWNGRGISALLRAGSAAPADAFERWFEGRLGRTVLWEPEPPARLRRQVEEALAGRGRRPRLDLEALTPFERVVLEKTREIPRGEVRTYGWVAREIGRPRAVRAVGSALGHNPIPLVIPCHRVVRSDGSLGEYGMGGPDAKRTYLQGEGVDLEGLEHMARRGYRFVGVNATRVFCVPSCKHAGGKDDEGRVLLRTEREARLSGFRPCRHCRPTS